MKKRSRARSTESIQFARNQRRSSNEFAFTVWQWIRNRQISDQKFRREHSIPPYTVDFCCVELKLIIEIDGDGHFTEEGRERDRVRDEYLASLGYKILRIPGYAVVRENGNAVQTIREFVQSEIATQSPSPPAPLPES
jgi:very-short-patch-repair endonuclease